MVRPHTPELRRRAIERARDKGEPISEVARDLGVSPSCLRKWVAQADIDEGRRAGVTSAERAELVELRRIRRASDMEDELRRKVAAYYARERVLPR